MKEFWEGSWVAQSVKRLTLGFSSGHDLTVHGLEPCVRLCAFSIELDVGLELRNCEIMT